MTKLAFLLGAIAAAGLACAKPVVWEMPPGDGCDGRFAFHETRRSARGASLSVESRCHVPATLDITFNSLINLEPDRPRPIRVLLEPGEVEPFVELRVRQAGSAWRYAVEYLYAPGSVPARHDDAARYAFPFGGSQPVPCFQGVHGDHSHWGRIAWDFSTPRGTPVLAARDGVVFQTVDGFGDGALEVEFSDRANVVLVLHDDDTMAIYAHLERGVVVSEGDRVVSGQLLGHSGSSGYSGGPHLHFEVAIPELHGFESVPIRFNGDVVPVPGEAYPPTSVSDATSAAASP